MFTPHSWYKTFYTARQYIKRRDAARAEKQRQATLRKQRRQERNAEVLYKTVRLVAPHTQPHTHTHGSRC